MGARCPESGLSALRTLGFGIRGEAFEMGRRFVIMAEPVGGEAGIPVEHRHIDDRSTGGQRIGSIVHPLGEIRGGDAVRKIGDFALA